MIKINFVAQQNLQGKAPMDWKRRYHILQLKNNHHRLNNQYISEQRRLYF